MLLTGELTTMSASKFCRNLQQNRVSLSELQKGRGFQPTVVPRGAAWCRVVPRGAAQLGALIRLHDC